MTPSAKHRATKVSRHLPVDIALLTTVTVERKAVCKAFNLTDKHRVEKEGRIYWVGRLRLNSRLGGKREAYGIAVAQSVDMASVDAALLANNAIQDWKPTAILLVGIAGAASNDVGPGDVVVGQAVYYDARGKITPGGKRPEPQTLPADTTLLRHAHAVPDWTSRIKAKRPDNKKQRPRALFGVIAAEEVVVADKTRRNQIKAAHRKILAVEMEGYGFSKAVWESFHHNRHIVVKAISDRASGSKNDKWQPYAAAAAASFVRHFLSDRPVKPKVASSVRPKTTTRRSPSKVNNTVALVEMLLQQPLERFDEEEFIMALKKMGIRARKVHIRSIEQGSTKVVITGDSAELEKIVAKLQKSGSARNAFTRSTGFVSAVFRRTSAVQRKTPKAVQVTLLDAFGTAIEGSAKSITTEALLTVTGKRARSRQNRFIAAVAEKSGLPQRKVSDVLDAITTVATGEINKGSREVVIPKLVKVNLIDTID